MSGWLQIAAVLEAGEADAKGAAALACTPGDVALAGWLAPPDRPGRPAAPSLVSPHRTPRRRLGSLKGRIALVHALAHIEFNAIDLAFDMALRFAPAIAKAGLDWRAFVTDWVAVGREEARHFMALSNRLGALGASYGDLPAHDGLWETAASTSDDVLARLALAPLVLEARGLDVTPKLIADLQAVGDLESSRILEMIYTDEIGHVRIGTSWFNAVALRHGHHPSDAFRRIVADRFKGELKPPFNEPARTAAGLMRDFYDPTTAPAPSPLTIDVNESKKRLVTSSHNSCVTAPDTLSIRS